MVSALIGVGIGILPGIGGGVSCMISYTVSKNTSKRRELYGTGIMDGVVASETANNGTIGGAMIPLLSLGIPGDAATAMLLGGLQIHNVAPGPLIYEKNGVVVYAIFFAMVLSAIFMMLFMLLGMRFFVTVLKVPKNFLLPVVVVLCAIGAIGNANMIFDTYCMVGFGLMSYLLIKSKVPTVPMILGFILGPTFEQNPGIPADLQRSLLEPSDFLRIDHRHRLCRRLLRPGQPEGRPARPGAAEPGGRRR